MLTVRVRVLGTIWAVAVAVTTAAAPAEGRPPREGPAELVSGTLARAEAVFSGRYIYTLATGSPPSRHVVRVNFVFSGSSWKMTVIEDAAGIPVVFAKSAQKVGLNVKSAPKLAGDQIRVTASHKGRTAVFNVVPQHSGGVRHDVRVVSGEQPLDKLSPPAPNCLGVLGSTQARIFIAARRDAAVLKPPGLVNGIRADIVEWPVTTKERGQAFDAATELTAQGGTLRLYVAPQFGFATPRVEYVGQDGRVGAVMDASDFIDVNGVGVPRRASIKYIDASGPTYLMEYNFSDITDINQPIDDQEFSVDLPPGTIVADSRSGTHSVFSEVQGGQGIPEDLGDLLARDDRPRRVAWWRQAVGLGLLISLLVAAVQVFRHAANRFLCRKGTG